MSRTPDTATTLNMYALYQQGNSLAQVAAAFRVTRQSVYERLHRRGHKLRLRRAPNPFVDFDGQRYALVVSGHYAGYYRKTKGDREMLHRAAWKKFNGAIPRGQEVHFLNGDKADVRPENLFCLPKGEAVTMRCSRAFTLKRCIACGEPMGRRFGWNTREGPAAYAKRRTCSAQCSADWKRGKPRGTRMP